MANDTTLTIVGNLTHDPELHYTNSGVACANLTVASTPRFFEKTSGRWRDGDALFLRCTAWRDLAEHVAESLERGQRVLVTGRLQQSSWERDGQKHTSIELTIDEIGPSLKWATARVKRLSRGGSDGSAAGAADDRWATSGPRTAAPVPAGAARGGFDDEPPF